MFAKTDSLQEVIEASKILFLSVEVKSVMGLPICNHPYTDSTMAAIEKSGTPTLVDITQEENYLQWKALWFNLFKKATSIQQLYYYVRNPYKLAFLHFSLPYIGKETFSTLLANAWVMQENPSMDTNVKPKEIIKWFRACSPENLMDENELKVYENLKDHFIIYRGVTGAINPYGLSWTTNKQKAIWFAQRYDGFSPQKGYVQSAIISKKDVLAYFNSRNESELVVDVYKIKDKIKIENDI